MKKSGLRRMLRASAATTGRKIEAVATLEVTAVIDETTSISSATAAEGGSDEKALSCSPTLADMPDARQPSATAKPPLRGCGAHRVWVACPAPLLCSSWGWIRRAGVPEQQDDAPRQPLLHL